MRGAGGGRVARAPRPRVAALLAEIRRSGSLRRAAHSLGMAPGNAHRLIRSEERRLGVRLLVGSQGGAGGGGSRLTPAGRGFARARTGSRPGITWWPCRVTETASRRSPIRVAIPEAGVAASVAPTGDVGRWTERLRQGSDLEIGIAPEALTLVRSTAGVSGSARNLWPARVVRLLRPTPFGIQFVELRVGGRHLAAAITTPAVADLGLGPGSNVKVQVKATALRLRLPPGV